MNIWILTKEPILNTHFSAYIVMMQCGDFFYSAHLHL